MYDKWRDTWLCRYNNTKVIKTGAPTIRPENRKLQKSIINHSRKKEELD